MSDPVSSKIRRLGDLPRDIPPPHDGWPALQARLRESGLPHAHTAPRRRPRAAHVAVLAAVLAAVVVGIAIDRWVLSSGPAPRPVMVARDSGGAGGGMPVAYLTDPRYLHERAVLLRSLNSRLARLPPPTRKQVLQSLATIEQSMRNIQQALGREPGNALLQELLIDTCQNEMQLLSTVQEASGGSGET